jgi:redox-sensitive bicupin YhaK (pirin superfamily)
MAAYKSRLYKTEHQGAGEFDNGKITETKPIDFPRGTGQGRRIGPLFYWAWASADGDGIISMHPHQAFEIISYCLKGTIGHSDSMDNKTRVDAGGAQVIKAGSGIHHQEEMHGERTEFFQIWFEPYLKETITHEPEYHQFDNDEFPAEDINGVRIKHVIGGNSPVKLVAEATADELQFQPPAVYERLLSDNRTLALVVISGKGSIQVGDEPETKIMKKDYFVVNADEETRVKIIPASESELKIFAVEVPTSVDYPLYTD